MINNPILPSENPNQFIILNLIENDLRSSCLVTGLEDLGLEAERYQLTLTESIFTLLGFSPAQMTEELLDAYYEEIGKGAVMAIVSSPQRLELKAMEIMEVMLFRRGM